MRWQDIGDVPCSVARTLAVIGDRWTMLILRNAFMRTRRFEDFQAQLGVTRHVLTSRLAKLVRAGVFDRVPYQERPRRYEYRLTDKGRDLYPIVVSMTRWGDRWLAGDAEPPLTLVHRDCGAVGAPTLACPECGKPVGARDMDARPSPALLAHLHSHDRKEATS